MVKNHEPPLPNYSESPGLILRVDNLGVDFTKHGTGDTDRAVSGVSFVVEKGRTLGIVGESGSGKTVTALAIMGLLPRNAIVSQEAKVLFHGRNFLELPERVRMGLRGKDMAMIFQEPATSLNPVFTVGDQIMEVLRAHLALSRLAAKHRAADLLHEVGIKNPVTRLGAYPHELSGGQQQRVMIAMAVACNPALLIADEPTTALDTSIQRQILDLLATLRERHAMSMVFISHDLDVVGEIADSIVIMRNGNVVEQGSVTSVLSQPKASYTKALLACKPRLDWRPSRLPVVEDILHGDSGWSGVSSKGASKKTVDEETLLDVRGLSKVYTIRTGLFHKENHYAVKDVSFRLQRGKTVGLVGESGSGKTTIARLLPKLIQPTNGEVLYKGVDVFQLSPEDLRKTRRQIQIIFQDPNGSLNPAWSVARILTEPMALHRIGSDSVERERMATALLDKVGIPTSAMSKRPSELSGGQRQRVGIARTLALKPDVVICDECVSALDVSVQAHILNLLKDLQEELAISYLFISHDLAVVKYMSDEILVLKDGQVLDRSRADTLGSHAGHPYTQSLFASLPKGRLRIEAM